MLHKETIYIFGAGRIGKQFILQLIANGVKNIYCVDIYANIEYLCYSLNYDSIYGRREDLFSVDKKKILNTQTGCEIHFLTSSKDITPELNSLAIDATGLKDFSLSLSDNFKRVYITNSAKADFIDQYVICGTADKLLKTSKYISTSICDATALAASLDLIDTEYKIRCGHITTLHPWLNYQNLSDGPVQLTSASTGYLEDFGLGRKSTESLIAKSTTAIKALQLCRNYVENFSSNSFRVPTPIVSAAVITVNTNYTINSSSDILNIFSKAKNITLTDRTRVSCDFIGMKAAAIVDIESVKINSPENQISLNLWYDNEAGYVSMVLDFIINNEEGF